MLILIVDDDKDYLSIMMDYFRRKGHSVWGAKSVLHAFQILHAEPIEILLTDERMPFGGSGPLLIEAVAHRWPAISCALVGGAPTNDSILRVTAIGAAVFTKGSPSEIVEFVNGHRRP